MSENRLVDGLLNSNEDAFETLVREYGGAMYSVILSIVNNPSDAQDCLQKAFVQVFENIQSFRRDSSLKTWLHRIAVNTALMLLRSQKRQKTVALEDYSQHYNQYGERTVFATNISHIDTDSADGSGNNIEQLFERNETKTSLHQLICQLPEKYCNVLLLRDIQGLSTKETSVYLDLSESVVKTQLHRARLFLKAALLKPNNLKVK
ncbi:MAG: sigma-70 family RNA polymerase sigma factor [Psychrosphaera sp.]|nr:sigma-70 family RNA polymerase sigma factor [Psychrosphaera sp.]